MNIPAILDLIRPGEQWVIHGNDYDKLTWLDSTPKPTIEELESGQCRLDALAYRGKRGAEYPSIGDQLDALWKVIAHGGFDELPGDAKIMLDKIIDVKMKYPKTI